MGLGLLRVEIGVGVGVGVGVRVRDEGGHERQAEVGQGLSLDDRVLLAGGVMVSHLLTRHLTTLLNHWHTD